MRRSSSPLLHDYKPTAAKSPKKSKAMQWFAVGLGIPLLGLALISTLDNSHIDSQSASPTPVMTAVAGDSFQMDEPIADFAVSSVPLVWAPEPEYETLTLKIRSGDTLDQLFRRHDLDVGSLSTVARLEAARSQFRKIKPGDVFEITHDQGRLISMYSALNLTSALRVVVRICTRSSSVRVFR